MINRNMVVRMPDCLMKNVCMKASWLVWAAPFLHDKRNDFDANDALNTEPLDRIFYI